MSDSTTKKAAEKAGEKKPAKKTVKKPKSKADLRSSSEKKSPKKAASTPLTQKKAPAAAAEKPERVPDPADGAERIDGVDLARRRRLARAGIDGDRCALLGVRLDVGPRADPFFSPNLNSLKTRGELMCNLARVILDSGVLPEDLEFAAARLRERSNS